MTVMGDFEPLNSKDSSPYSSLPLISTPGGSRAGIWVFVGAGSRPVLLQTSRQRPLQALNRADFEPSGKLPRTSSRQLRIQFPKFKSTGKLRVDASQAAPRL